MLIVQLSLLLVTLYCVNAQLSGIARFDTRNLRGYVRFTELENGNVEIRTNFSDLPFDDALPYHVHLYPVDYRYDPTVRCGASYTGGHFDPTDRLGAAGDRYSEFCSPSNRTACEYGDLSGRYGRLTNGTFTNEDSDLSLNGIQGILYRSVVIHMADGARYVCATIEPTSSLDSTVTAIAVFYGNLISGNVYFFQQDADSESTKIFVDLSPVNTDRNLLTNLGWVIKNSAPGVGSRRGFCSYVGERYNPRGRNVDNCDREDTSRCPEYALTEKHGYLSLTGETNKFFFTEVRGITLSGINSIIGRSLVIELGNRIVGCAAIEVVNAIRVRAQLPNGIEFTATQYFPCIATRVSRTGLSSFSRLELQQNGYINGVCDGSATRYDPFVQTSTTRGLRTPDASRLGDLLEQIPSDGESMLSSIPLSGPFSAADRTIWYTAGNLSGCSFLAYDLRDRTDNAFVIRAKATFNNLGFSCMVYFSQLVTGVSYLPSSGDRVSNPNFQSGDVILTDNCTDATDREYRFVVSSDCNSTTEFFNPYEILRQDTDRSLYDQDCDRGNQRRCTVGNNLRQVTSDSLRSYVNTNLELIGAYGVASSRINVQLNGVNCAALEVIGEVSAVYSVDSCEQFNNRLGNAIEYCTGVESNTFLPIECSDDNINAEDGTVSVDVGMIFAPETDTTQAEECILEFISSGNKLEAFLSIFLMVAISLLMIA